MRKFFILLILLSLSSPTYAKETSLRFSNFAEIQSHARMVTFSQTPVPINVNGLIVTPIAPITYVGLSNYKLNSNTICTTDGYSYLGVKGVSIMLINNTQSVVVISWKDSIVSANGSIYGMPYFSNEPYRNAGNPSTTANTIIPPKSKMTINPCSALDGYQGSFWLRPIPLPRNTTLSFSYYLNVTVNGQTSYITLETPGIYLPAP